MNFNIPKITKDCDIAVHCPNQNDFIELALFLEDEFDFTATKGFTSGSLWNNNKENTCLHIRPGAYDIPHLLYGPLEWAQEHNSQIYEFKNLIIIDCPEPTLPNEPFIKKSMKEVYNDVGLNKD